MRKQRSLISNAVLQQAGERCGVIARNQKENMKYDIDNPKLDLEDIIAACGVMVIVASIYALVIIFG